MSLKENMAIRQMVDDLRKRHNDTIYRNFASETDVLLLASVMDTVLQRLDSRDSDDAECSSAKRQLRREWLDEDIVSRQQEMERVNDRIRDLQVQRTPKRATRKR